MSQSQSQLLDASQRSASQGAALKHQSKQSKYIHGYIIFHLESNGKSKKAKQYTKTNQENTPLKREYISASKVNVEEYEEKLNHDHLKSAITALNEKLKFYENVDQERSNLQQQLEETSQARDELRNSIKETSEIIQEEKDKNVRYQGILINENQSLSNQILDITNMFSSKVEEFDEMKQTLQNKEKEINDLKIEKDNLQDYHDKYQRECTQRHELCQRYNDLNKQIEEKAHDYQQSVDKITNSKEKLS